MSLKKIRRKHYRKYKSLLRLAQINDLSMQQTAVLRNRINDLKRVRRLKKRYGEHFAWDQLDNEGFFKTVPVYLKTKNEIVSYRVVQDKEDMPMEYQYLWGDKASD